MARLDKLIDYLFTHAGTTLLLESGSPGFFEDARGNRTPVFKQCLRWGQILLLLEDTVPADRSQDFRAGRPIKFVYETPQGGLSVELERKGKELRARVAIAAEAEELLSSVKGLSADSTAAVLPRIDVVNQRITLSSVIAQLIEKRASHLHLAPDRPAFVRIDGRLLCLEEAGPFSATEVREALSELAPAAIRETFLWEQRFEFTHVSNEKVIHVRGQQGREGLSVVVRARPRQVPAAASLGVPDDFARVLRGSGLWVVAGGAGEGTSTTVAALVQGALEARSLDVCTIDSPIDYLLEPKRGLVQQLEIGVHAPSFAAALEDARRGDADLVTVGELGDPQTLAAALALGDCGRLVVGVLHAKSAVAALQKLVDLAPPGSSALATQLRGVFAQRLVPNRSGGRSLCWELLPGTDAVKALVKERAVAEVAPLLTRTFDQSLLQLAMGGELDAEVALAHARNRAWLEEQLSRVGHPRAA